MTPYDTDESMHEHWSDQPMAPAMADLLDKALTPLQTDLERLQRKVADGASTAALQKIGADLATVAEQSRLTSSRLNEELGALGVQLRQQHMDVGDRIKSMQAGIGAQFDAVAAAIAASSSHVSRVADQLAQRQRSMVADAVQKELDLQLLPLQARVRALTGLLGVSVGLSLGCFIMMIMSLLR